MKSHRNLPDHPGAGNIADDFCSRQMSADSRFCSLAHFNLNGGSGIEVILMNAEAAGGYLNYGIFSIAIEILMEAPFSGIVENPQLGGSTGQGCVGVIADGAVAHSRKQHRMESSSWGGSWQVSRPASSRFTGRGFCPRNTRVSMGSRKGSMMDWSPERR